MSNIRSSRERPRCSPCLRDLLPRATRGGLRFSRESWEGVPGSVSICGKDISFYLGQLGAANFTCRGSIQMNALSPGVGLAHVP